jgi:hypothetical protein
VSPASWAQTAVRRVIPCAVLLLLATMMSAPLLAADDDEEGAAPAPGMAEPALDDEQLRSVGIVVAAAGAARAPERLTAYGEILSSADLLSDWAEMRAAHAAATAAAAESVRLREVHAAGAGGSLKLLEAAQTERAKQEAQSEALNARFAQRWGPILTLPEVRRAPLLASLRRGRSLLLRAEVPGRHQLGTIPPRALIDVDGVQLPGTVLGPLLQRADTQGVGLLVELTAAPATLAAGARLAVSLLSPPRTGWRVPAEALLYDDRGAFVYKRLERKSGEARTRFKPVVVQLLAPLADGWLIDGVDGDDQLVVRGAGVLWSLQGVAGSSGDDD